MSLHKVRVIGSVECTFDGRQVFTMLQLAVTSTHVVLPASGPVLLYFGLATIVFFLRLDDILGHCIVTHCLPKHLTLWNNHFEVVPMGICGYRRKFDDVLYLLISSGRIPLSVGHTVADAGQHWSRSRSAGHPHWIASIGMSRLVCDSFKVYFQYKDHNIKSGLNSLLNIDT